ncbi:MAG: tRNA (guanosine(37)-N1)-methyltransferase TrmD [Chloroflexota bacterium]
MTEPEDAGQEIVHEKAVPVLSVDIVTLFPRLFDCWLEQGVVSRAIRRGIVDVRTVELRPFGIGRHQVTDDYPFGGGKGMVMKPEPLFAAVESLSLDSTTPVILLSPAGRRFDQSQAQRLAMFHRVVMVAGHYEGVDDRVRHHLVTEELSIGDYVVSAGELAAMVVIDTIVRLVPGALSEGSAREESFAGGLLEYPQYTRPAVFRGWAVPETLLSGHHGQIREWRRDRSVERTREVRPDLLADVDLTVTERQQIENDETR